MTTPIELIGAGDQPADRRQTAIWKLGEPSVGFHTGIDPWLSKFGKPSIESITLARVGVGAFIADRAVTRNPLRQKRDIELVIKVPDPDLGYGAQDNIQLLLGFVTGDNWKIDFEPDTSERAPPTPPAGEVSEVSLLSGGLDSYCGALIGGNRGRLFFSHSDSPVTTYSQRRAIRYLPGFDHGNHRMIRVATEAPFANERSRRSRSVLFIALAVALADSCGAARVEVPENGFTSLNPPLTANRGGVLTTRSTHPMTFALVKSVLTDLGLGVEIRNPYQWLTKGDLLTTAIRQAGEEAVRNGLASTLSCSKTNLILKNSGYGRNCGLDYACIVRRAAVYAAHIEDNSDYVCNQVDLASDIIALRRDDIEAVRKFLAETPTLLALAARCGPFPNRFDYEGALQLWKRGRNEIEAIELP